MTTCDAPSTLGHGGAHAVVAEAVDARADTPVGVPEHPPDAGRPRHAGLALVRSERHRRGVAGRWRRRLHQRRDMGADRLVEALRRQRELLAAIKPVVLH